MKRDYGPHTFFVVVLFFSPLNIYHIDKPFLFFSCCTVERVIFEEISVIKKIHVEEETLSLGSAKVNA